MKKTIIFAGVIMVVLFAGCIPFEGNLDEVREKADGGGTRYTITFESDGGSTVKDQKVKEGGTVKKPVNPTRGNDLFVNWFIDEECEDIYIFSTPVTAGITLYAKWIAYGTPRCYVEFESNDGSFVGTQPVYEGEKAFKPDDPTKRGHEFVGWYKEDLLINPYNFSALVTSDMKLYAKWNKVTDVPGATLAEKFTWLSNNAFSDTEYIVQANASETLGPQNLTYTGYTPLTIRLKGSLMFSRPYIVTLSGNGYLFTIGSGVTLFLEDYITLKGHSSNNTALVRVNPDGKLFMQTNSVITGNTNTTTGAGSSNGGGVAVAGLFTMNDGTISGNTASRGGGVYVDAFAIGGTVVAGKFIMIGGTISGNTASMNGGGVYVQIGSGAAGIFTKDGGTIFGSNEGSNSNAVKNSSGMELGNSGHAAYVAGTSFLLPGKRRETTAGTGSDGKLDSTKSGEDGGWDTTAPIIP